MTTGAPNQLPPGELQPGHRLDCYEIQRLAGRGAAGEVYLAAEVSSGQAVALKLLRRSAGQGETSAREVARRFQHEASTAMGLEHPDIVRTLAAGTLGERAWLAMEWVAGHELTRYTSPTLLLPELLALEIVRRVARALGHAHRQGVLHRDIKPSNIRVNLPAHIVKLGDFGIARTAEGMETRTGILLGTPAYMAPELLAGEKASPRSDLYALAVLAFELFAGRRPHEASAMGELLRLVTAEPAPCLSDLRADMPVALNDLLARTLSRKPDRRPSDCEQFALELDEALSTLQARGT